MGRNPNKYKCMNLRARYERRKAAFVNTQIELAEKRQRDKERTKGVPPDLELMENIMQYKKDLEWTNRGTIQFYSIQDIVEKIGYSIGRSKARALGQRILGKYGDELKPYIDKAK